MKRYVAGDRAAFRELFNRYAPILERMLLRDLRARDEARDLVQQTFLLLHRSRLDFDSNQRLKPWLFTIALNLKRDYFRRTKRRLEVPYDPASRPEPGVAARGVERHEAAQAVATALDHIPADQREVIELHWFEGLSFEEIGQALGASVSAVKVRAHRGYTRMRGVLGGVELPEVPLGQPEPRRADGR